MYRNMKVTSTLEEDFKKLGLLVEGDQQTPGPSGEPATNKGSKSRNVGAMTDDPDNEGGTGTDEMPGEPHQGKPGKTIPETPVPAPMKSEAIKGMPDKYRATEADEEDDDDKDPDDDKEKKNDKEEESRSFGANAVIESVAKARAQRENRDMDQVSALLQSVNSIIESIDNTKRNESVKAFANVSIISEMLHRSYSTYADRTSDAGLSETAKAFSTMSEEAAEVAKAIEANEDLDPEKVEALFREHIDALMAGLDLYSEMVEAPVEEEKEDDKDPDDDEPPPSSKKGSEKGKGDKEESRKK